MTFDTKWHTPAEQDQYTGKVDHETNYIKYAAVIIRRHRAPFPSVCFPELRNAPERRRPQLAGCSSCCWADLP